MYIATVVLIIVKQSDVLALWNIIVSQYAFAVVLTVIGVVKVIAGVSNFN